MAGKGNTLGRVVAPSPSAKVPASKANPPVKAEVPQESLGTKVLDGTQLVLDAAGMVPALGAIPDVANAGISALRGDWVGAGLSLAAAIPFAGWGASAAKVARRGAKAVAKEVAKEAVEKAAKEATEKVALKAAKEKAAKEAAERAAKKKAEEAAAKGGKGGKGGGDGGKIAKPPKRKPKRRCELVPYEELECGPGQDAHHVVPDWMLRVGKRKGPERIPGLPSLDRGPAICLERGSGKEHNVAHKHTDRPAQRVARSGRSTGTPGTLKLGQGKLISARAIEKATGGRKGGGCDRKDIQKQLDAMIRAHNDTLLRGVKDARKVTEKIVNAVRKTTGEI